MILADTSAWVEYDRATGSAVDQRLTDLIGSEGPLVVTEPVLMEVMAGARDDRREESLRRLLLRFDLLAFDAAVDFDAAARIYRRCRRAGVTPRGMVDCLIASVAWRHEATLLAQDVDLSRVAKVVGIQLDWASLTQIAIPDRAIAAADDPALEEAGVPERSGHRRSYGRRGSN